MVTTNRRAKALETITLGQLLDHEFPAREDLVSPWLRQGESAMIWAAVGVGKTLLTLTLGLMVAGGGSVLGWHAPKPRRVLLVDGEMSAEDLQERVTWLQDTIEGIDREAVRENLRILSRTWQGADVAFPDLGEREGREGRPSGQDVVMQEAKAHRAELVLLDNYSTLAEVADENDAAAMTPTLAFLLRMKQARIGCVLVHHSGKSGETYRGSSKLATTFEVILGLRAIEDMASSGAAFKLDWTKYRREPCEAVRSRDVRLVKDGTGQRRWEATESADDEIRKLLIAVRTCGYSNQKEIAAAIGWDTSKVSRTKNKAMSDGRIKKEEWDRCLQEASGAVAESDF